MIRPEGIWYRAPLEHNTKTTSTSLHSFRMQMLPRQIEREREKLKRPFIIRTLGRSYRVYIRYKYVCICYIRSAVCGRLHMLLGYAEMENNARQLAAEIAQLQILYTIYMIYGELGGGRGNNSCTVEQENASKVATNEV